MTSQQCEARAAFCRAQAETWGSSWCRRLLFGPRWTAEHAAEWEHLALRWEDMARDGRA